MRLSCCDLKAEMISKPPRCKILTQLELQFLDHAIAEKACYSVPARRIERACKCLGGTSSLVIASWGFRSTSALSNDVANQGSASALLSEEDVG